MKTRVALSIVVALAQLCASSAYSQAPVTPAPAFDAALALLMVLTVGAVCSSSR